MGVKKHCVYHSANDWICLGHSQLLDPPLPLAHVPLQELLVPAQWGYMSTGTCAHGFVVYFDDWASHKCLTSFLYLNTSFLQPTFRPVYSIPTILTGPVKNGWILIDGAGTHYHPRSLSTWIWEASVFTSRVMSLRQEQSNGSLTGH